MDDISEKCCLVYDYGANLSLARRLAREFGRVLYFRPWKESEPKTSNLAVGDGFPDIERVRHFWQGVQAADLVCFPDLYDGDLQIELERQGKRVWGSRMAERLEYDRPHFLKTLQKVGLPCVEHTIITGVSNLEAYLHESENENQWVKVNLRGDDETWHHETWEGSRAKLRAMHHQYDALGDFIVFTVCRHIDSTVESAYDGFMVTSPDGEVQWPNIGFLGYENKNASHILHAIPYGDFPGNLREVNEKFAPECAALNLRGGFGTEVKTTEEGMSFFLDFTAGRQPSPPGEIIMEQVSNLGAFFWHGSVGECIPLEIEHPFGVQVIFYSGWAESNTAPLLFPEELDRWVKHRGAFRDANGIVQLIPEKSKTVHPSGYCIVGSVVALGDTIEEAIELSDEYRHEVKGPYLDNEFKSLSECLSRIRAGEKLGIEFADEPIPEPASVIEETA